MPDPVTRSGLLGERRGGLEREREGRLNLTQAETGAMDLTEELS